MANLSDILGIALSQAPQSYQQGMQMADMYRKNKQANQWNNLSNLYRANQSLGYSNDDILNQMNAVNPQMAGQMIQNTGMMQQNRKDKLNDLIAKAYAFSAGGNEELTEAVLGETLKLIDPNTNPQAYQGLTKVMSAKPNERFVMLQGIIERMQKAGYLPGANETGTQADTKINIMQQNADTARLNAISGFGGEKLKLEQLINKLNSLPDGSKEREIYQAAIDKEIRSPGQAKQRPFVSQLMADGWLPSGRITTPMLDAFEAAAERASELGKPLSVEDLRKMDFEATKNRSTGRTAGSRLTLQRKQNIEAAFGLLNDLKKTSNKLDYSQARFIGNIEKFKNGQLNDPIFTEYMSQRADALFVLGNALKQNGLTDKSIEVEEEAFNPTLSPKAFNAWYNTQLRALNRAAEEMNKDYGYGINLQPVFEAGTGGSGNNREMATPEQVTATNPQTGEKLIFRNGQWQPL